MGDKLQKVLYELDLLERTSKIESPLHKIDTRAKLLVTIVFLVCMLSLKIGSFSELLLYFVYPIATCSISGLSYGYLFRRSMIVLPFVVLIGIFNPILDRQPVFYLSSVAITQGWISFVSIILRGILSVQAVLLMIYSSGFYNFCRALQKFHVPPILTTQLMFVYRYLFVLIEEFDSMRRARDARSFGRKGYPLKIWSVMVGQLMIRSFERAERIHAAMAARGFNGRVGNNIFLDSTWSAKETQFTILWSVSIIAVRLFHPIELIAQQFTIQS